MSQRTLWRWHFYAGLFVAPVLLVLAATGGLYLFDRELDAFTHARLLHVEPGGTALSLAEQESLVLQAVPDGTPVSMTPARGPDTATRWTLRLADGSSRELFLNPGTGRIQGTVNPDRYPTTIARKLHSSLLAGTTGRYLVELTACWTLVMLVTGLTLWWPKSWNSAAFVPRLRNTGRPFWRDWHAIPAMFNASLVLLLVLTGLPWSVFWGEQLAKLGGRLPLLAPSPNFTAAPPAAGSGLPWTIHHHGTPQGTPVDAPRIGIIEPALARIDTRTHGPGLKVIYPAAPGGVFMASYVPARAEDQRTLYLDPGDGRVLGDISWRDYSPAAKTIEWGVMTHMGQQYGRANQLANLAVCLALIGTTVAGVVLWWKRRPAGKLGAPPRTTDDRLPRGIVVMLWVLGLLFPLLGATLIPVALLDRYAATRFRG